MSLGMIGRRNILRLLGALLIALTFSCLPPRAFALDTGQTKRVGSLVVYLGAMPAEIVKGHPSTHPEARMHGGPPRGRHEYHLVVAIFDGASGARVEDAKLSARVSAIGLAGPKKALEPMQIAGTVTYGNYFDLPDKGPYTINLVIERPRGTVRVDFMYEHN